jgi:antitoxin (DNA-binding transcriptional repressor) of toxin-antitoxin stability system
MKKDIIVGLKELRENMETYISRVHKGDSFIVVRKSKPVFKISLPDEDTEEFWDTIVDFTKIRKGGVPAEEVLSALRNLK